MAYVASNYKNNPSAPVGKWACAPTSTFTPFDEAPSGDQTKESRGQRYWSFSGIVLGRGKITNVVLMLGGMASPSKFKNSDPLITLITLINKIVNDARNCLWNQQFAWEDIRLTSRSRGNSVLGDLFAARPSSRPIELKRGVYDIKSICIFTYVHFISNINCR